MPTRSQTSPRRSRRSWLLAAGLAVLAFAIAERRWLTLNDITTGQTPEYPELKPRLYTADETTTRAAALAACHSLPRWRVVSHNDAGEIHAEVRTLLFDFIDDVTVRFEPAGTASAPQTRVLIRSHSRVGKGDLGENARHIQALQAAMDRRLRQAGEPAAALSR
jgi:uncharacterized protein (DUF1499 family)